jgi:hypothetical protein
MTTNIYDRHKAAFQNVSAYVIALNGDRVALIAFKYPRDGASRLYAYVHWIGVPMVRGFAGGGGYDKHSAAVADAVRKAIEAHKDDAPVEATDELRARATFFRTLRDDGGEHWHRRLRDAGFEVWQAV